MKLAVWSPLPPSPSGIADYVAEQLPALRAHADVACVAEDPLEAPAADLHVYHLGNSPAHGYVYRAACRTPGIAVLHEWNLHHLVLHETLQRGDRGAYLREMRRSWGDTGTVVARQIAQGLGGDLLPARFALNDSVLRNSLAVVGLTRYTCTRAELGLRGRPVLYLPHHVSVPLDPLPSRAEARRLLGLPPSAPIVCAPGLATANKRLDVALRAIGGLRASRPDVLLVVAGGVDPVLPLPAWAESAGMSSALHVTGRLELADLVRHLVAADVVLSLRFPTYGETSGVLMRALGVGRPVLVTAGTPPADEIPEGVVVPVAPGPCEEAELRALLDRLLGDDALCGKIGALARAHARQEHDLQAGVTRLAAFLRDVAGRRDDLAAHVASRRADDGSLLGLLTDEARFAALDLGLPGLPLDVDERLAELAGARRDP